MELQKMFIDGEWVEGSTGKSVPTLNPSNGEVLAMVTEGNVEDVDKAIAAAKKSFYVTREWRDMDSQTRADILLQMPLMRKKRVLRSWTAWIMENR